MNRHKNTMTDQQLDEILAQTHQREWTGPDHSTKVDRYLNPNPKGLTMKSQPNRVLSRSALILLGVGALAGGGLATAVTHSIMSRSATIITDDGSEYNVELLETADGASGTFVTDDGSVFNIVQDAQQVTVDVTSTEGGTSTVIFDDGIEISESDDEKLSESDE